MIEQNNFSDLMHSKDIFITGTGTGVGKTLVAAIVAEAIGASYWKPIQCGYSAGTDSEWVEEMLTGKSVVYPEHFKFKLAASPHIAAREENIQIELEEVCDHYVEIKASPAFAENVENVKLATASRLIIEGPGGLLVPLNDREFVIDLIRKLKTKVIIVSRNYLGSINHSLLTVQTLRATGVEVSGWVFNDNFMQYENEIAAWSGYPILFSVPAASTIDQDFIRKQAAIVRDTLFQKL